jgi:DNA-binding GntR family transcriptional regulator
MLYYVFKLTVPRQTVAFIEIEIMIGITTPTPLEILQSKSLSMAVQNEIFKLILQGEFNVGEKLSEAALATRLGVSRGPVREAFRALEEAGLVTLSKNRGVFVKEFTAEDVRELYEVRVGLDQMVGRILAPMITDPQLQELQSHIALMDESLANEDLAGYFPQNIHFHERIVEMTGNKKLLSVYRRTTNEMHLMRRRSIVNGGGKLLSNDEHQSIVDALATRDGEIAARVMGDHGTAGYRRLLESRSLENTTPGKTPIRMTA